MFSWPGHHEIPTQALFSYSLISRLARCFQSSVMSCPTRKLGGQTTRRTLGGATRRTRRTFQTMRRTLGGSPRMKTVPPLLRLPDHCRETRWSCSFIHKCVEVQNAQFLDPLLWIIISLTTISTWHWNSLYSRPLPASPPWWTRRIGNPWQWGWKTLGENLRKLWKTLERFSSAWGSHQGRRVRLRVSWGGKYMASYKGML